MCERNIDQLPLTRCQPGTWSTAQVCALTGNWTGDIWFARWCSTKWATSAKCTIMIVSCLSFELHHIVWSSVTVHIYTCYSWCTDHFIIMKCPTILSLVNLLLTAIVSDSNIVVLSLLCLLFALYIFFLSTYWLFRSKLCLWRWHESCFLIQSDKY